MWGVSSVGILHGQDEKCLHIIILRWTTLKHLLAAVNLEPVYTSRFVIFNCDIFIWKKTQPNKTSFHALNPPLWATKESFEETSQNTILFILVGTIRSSSFVVITPRSSLWSLGSSSFVKYLRLLLLLLFESETGHCTRTWHTQWEGARKDLMENPLEWDSKRVSPMRIKSHN